MGITCDPVIAVGLSYGLPMCLAASCIDATIKNASTSGDAESIFPGGRNGNDVPYIPDVQISFGLGHEARLWGLGAVATFVHGSFGSASNTTLQVDQDGNPDTRFGRADRVATVDVSGHHALRDGVRILGGVQNVLDAEYLSARRPLGPRPGKPRISHAGFDAPFRSCTARQSLGAKCPLRRGVSICNTLRHA